jgi:hypothetical protein
MGQYDIHDVIRDIQYTNEDRVCTDLNKAVSMGMSLGGGPDDFMRQMVAFLAYKAAEHVLRIEDGARRNPNGDPARHAKDVDLAKNQYVKALLNAKNTLGTDFDRLYEMVRQENNENSRVCLEQSNGMMYYYVVPKFNDDGTHDPLGPRDFPWATP